MAVRVEASVQYMQRDSYNLLRCFFSAMSYVIQSRLCYYLKVPQGSHCVDASPHTGSINHAIVCIPTVTRGSAAVAASEIVRTFQVSRSI